MICIAASLVDHNPRVFSKRAVLRSAIRTQDAPRDHHSGGRWRTGGSVGSWSQTEHPSETGAEGSDAGQSYLHADPQYGPVGVAQQRRRPFKATGEQVLVRRFAKGFTELSAEVSGGEAGGACQIRDRQLLGVPSVGQILGSQQIASGRDMRHGSHPGTRTPYACYL